MEKWTKDKRPQSSISYRQSYRLKQIKLSEIPTEGDTFEVDLLDNEIWENLKDLLGAERDEAYLKASVQIFPIGSNRYTLKGQISCAYKDACSRCGIDFSQPLRFKCDEILLPALEAPPRNSSFKKANHLSQSLEVEGELESIEIEGGVFNLIEYIHEQIGLNQPLYPIPPQDGDSCSVCEKPISEGSFNYEESGVEKLSPFEVLKSLKP